MNMENNKIINGINLFDDVVGNIAKFVLSLEICLATTPFDGQIFPQIGTPRGFKFNKSYVYTNDFDIR